LAGFWPPAVVLLELGMNRKKRKGIGNSLEGHIVYVRVLQSNGIGGTTGKCFIKSKGNLVFSPLT
jgi:hypothetical protein